MPVLFFSAGGYGGFLGGLSRASGTITEFRPRFVCGGANAFRKLIFGGGCGNKPYGDSDISVKVFSGLPPFFPGQSFTTKYDAPLATRSAPNVSGGSWARPSPNCMIPRCRSASARTPTPASFAISIFYASVMVDPDSIPEPLNDGLAKSASGGDGLLANPRIVARSQR